MPRLRLLPQPIRGSLESLRQQLDIKDFLSVVGLLFLQEIDQERG
jgi:hypothetical protein